MSLTSYDFRTRAHYWHRYTSSSSAVYSAERHFSVEYFSFESLVVVNYLKKERDSLFFVFRNSVVIESSWDCLSISNRVANVIFAILLRRKEKKKEERSVLDQMWNIKCFISKPQDDVDNAMLSRHWINENCISIYRNRRPSIKMWTETGKTRYFTIIALSKITDYGLSKLRIIRCKCVSILSHSRNNENVKWKKSKVTLMRTNWSINSKISEQNEQEANNTSVVPKENEIFYGL